MFFWKMENVNLKQFESLRQKRLLGCVLKKKRKKRRKKEKRVGKRSWRRRLPRLFFDLDKFSYTRLDEMDINLPILAPHELKLRV